MTLDNVMSDAVVTVLSSTPIIRARELMRKHRIHHLVVTGGANLVGIVSASDLTHESVRRKAKTVADVMTRHVMTIDGRATPDRAAYVMRGRSIGCLVVLRHGEVVGIVTPSDLLGEFDMYSRRRKRASSRTALHHRVGHHHRARGDGVW